MALPLVCTAAPYKPVDDAQVLERLPDGVKSKTLRSTRGRLYDPEVAAVLARSYIERARRESDPRDLGYAQGLLEPWWNAVKPPLPVLLLRATLRQSRHDFNGALQDLDLFLQQRPNEAQAWLTRATVQRVLGRYPEATQSCARLQALAMPFVAELCRLSVAGLSGQLAESYAALLQLRAQSASQPFTLQAWMYAELGDMAERLGKSARSEAHFRAGLALGDDHGLRAACADLLLDHGRAREAVALVEAYDHVDALRLRHALALNALNDPGFTALDRQIMQGHASARLRNEDLHLREEARYLLEAHRDFPEALRRAEANWQVQHEPADALLLLQAAQAAAQPQAAAPVLQWLQDSGMQDDRLGPYLKGAP